MPRIEFSFDLEKAIEVIIYLASKLPVPNLYGICKSLYLADKAHLERYGRFLFGETYVAMYEGGTPSNVYNILKDIRREPTAELTIEDNIVKASRMADLDYFSESDIECLDEIIEEYGNPSKWTERKKACHDNAWQQAWDSKGSKRSNPIPIENIAEMLDESGELIDFLGNTG